MARICDLEATYSFALEKFQENPTREKQLELVEKQIMIDEKRSWEYEPLRWFTRAELKGFEEDEETKPRGPRYPLALSEDWEWAEKPKMVKVDDTVTMTLNAVIASLEKLREKHGGEKPVFHVGEFGQFVEIFKLTEYNGKILVQ